MSSVKDVLSRLPLIDENILEEAANQPQLFIDAARYRVAKMRKLYAAKVELEEFEASRGLAERDKMRSESETDGKKGRAAGWGTERHIKSLVMKSKRHKRLRYSVSDAEAREEFSKLLLKAIEMRSNAIRIIADAQNREAARGAGEVERIEQRRKLTNEARRLQAKYRENRD